MNTYYNPDDLAKFPTIGEEAPELWDAFLKYYGPVMAEGALTAREKALIALAVAHSEMCPRCSGYESWNYTGSWRADEKRCWKARAEIGNSVTDMSCNMCCSSYSWRNT